MKYFGNKNNFVFAVHLSFMSQTTSHIVLLVWARGDRDVIVRGVEIEQARATWYWSN